MKVKLPADSSRPRTNASVPYLSPFWQTQVGRLATLFSRAFSAFFWYLSGVLTSSLPLSNAVKVIMGDECRPQFRHLIVKAPSNSLR